jgi:hypothetical protein
VVFGAAWNGRKYSIKSATALRAFIRVAPDVVRRLDQEHADRTDFRAIGRVIAPWGRRIGDLRFETDGAWKRSGTTVDAGEGTAPGPAVPGGRARPRRHPHPAGCRSIHHSHCRIPRGRKEKRAPRFLARPRFSQTTRLPSNSRLPAVNIQAACVSLLSKRCTRDFSEVFGESRSGLGRTADEFVSPITIRIFGSSPCHPGGLVCALHVPAGWLPFSSCR